MLLILQLICVFYMFAYAVSPKRSKWGRIAAISIALLSFFIPCGGYLAILWGAVCWSDARAGNQ